MSRVAQYIGADLMPKNGGFWHKKRRFVIFRFRTVVKHYPFEKASKIAKFEQRLDIG